MLNPYAPSESTSTVQSAASSQKRSPVKRTAMLIALMLIAVTSLLAGAATGFMCAWYKGVDQDEMKNIVSFFMGFAIVFAMMGMYLGQRYMAGRIALWYIIAAFSSFAVTFVLSSSPNYGTVSFWIAGLTVSCAVSTTLITRTACALASSQDTSDNDEA
jgi:phosphate/sulfate permease